MNKQIHWITCKVQKERELLMEQHTAFPKHIKPFPPGQFPSPVTSLLKSCHSLSFPASGFKLFLIVITSAQSSHNSFFLKHRDMEIGATIAMAQYCWCEGWGSAGLG